MYIKFAKFVFPVLTLLPTLIVACPAWAQTTYQTYPAQTPEVQPSQAPSDHPVADGIGTVARSGARALGDVANGIATGVDDLAHTTARAVNPNPNPAPYSALPPQPAYRDSPQVPSRY